MTPSSTDSVKHTGSPIQPVYYVRHPDGRFSVAKPQPTPEELALSQQYIYAQCDQVHGGPDCCEDPDCYRQQLAAIALRQGGES